MRKVSMLLGRRGTLTPSSRQTTLGHWIFARNAAPSSASVRGSPQGQNPVLPIDDHLRQSRFNKEFIGAMSA
jgi:hypothetical protein